jgi:DNA polymerase/3'-5' exonuclease PolX
MSTATRIPLAQAAPLAEAVRQTLAPFCMRIEVAGSIRRQRPTIGDVEIVAVPQMVTTGLFDDTPAIDPGFIAAVDQWPVVKGKATGKQAQRLLPSGIIVDLYMTTLDQWGLILAIRTGRAAYTKWLLGRHAPRRGYRSVDGYFTRTRDGQVIPIREEADLFTLLELPYVEPPAREV